MSERYFNLFMRFGDMHIYLAVKDELSALRFEARFDSDHSRWVNGMVEYHSRISRNPADENESYICGLFGEDSCFMHHDIGSYEIDAPCLKAMNLQDTDAVYKLLESVWVIRPEWMKEGKSE